MSFGCSSVHPWDGTKNEDLYFINDKGVVRSSSIWWRYQLMMKAACYVNHMMWLCHHQLTIWWKMKWNLSFSDEVFIIDEQNFINDCIIKWSGYLCCVDEVLMKSSSVKNLSLIMCFPDEDIFIKLMNLWQPQLIIWWRMKWNLSWGWISDEVKVLVFGTIPMNWTTSKAHRADEL